MNRWILSLMVGATALLPTLDARSVLSQTADGQWLDRPSASEPSPDGPAYSPQTMTEDQAIAQIWEQIHHSQLSTVRDRDQALQHLASAQQLMPRIQDDARRHQLLAALVKQYVALEEMETAIALTAGMDSTLYNPDHCCTPWRTEAEMAIARGYGAMGQNERAVAFTATIAQPSRDQVWGALIEQMAHAGQLSAAIALLPNLARDESGNDYDYVRAQHSILRGYSLNRQFAEGLLFSRTLTAEDERSAAQFNLVQAALRAGEYGTARQIIPEISAPWSQLEALRMAARAAIGAGKSEEALALLAEGESLLQSLDTQSFADWIRHYAEAGAVDRAIQETAQLTNDYDRAESYINIGHVLLRQGQLTEALAIAQRVRDGELQILADYEDPKVLLLNAIAQQAAVTGQYDLAAQVARSLGRPEQRVNLLLQTASQARHAGETQRAIALLWEGFEIAQTIDRIGYHVDRHLYIETSNAPLLLQLAQALVDLGESERAIAALDSAVESMRTFEHSGYPASSVPDPEPWLTLARLYAEAGQPSQSQQMLETAMTIATETQDLGWKARQFAQISVIYAHLNQRRQAQALLTEAEQILDSLEAAPQLGGMTAVVQGYLALKQPRQATAIARSALETAQAIEDRYQRDTLLGPVAIALGAAPNPDPAIQLATAITDPLQRTQTLAEIAAQQLARGQVRQGERVIQHLLTTTFEAGDPFQRDSLLSNLIYYQYAPFEQTAPRWQYELAKRLTVGVEDARARATNEVLIALGYARVNDQPQAEASINRSLAATQAISDRALREETLGANLEVLIQAEQPELAALLVQGFTDPAMQVVVLRQLAQQYVQRGDQSRSQTLMAQAMSATEAIADLPSRTQLLEDLRVQQATWSRQSQTIQSQTIQGL
jgi:thioredoxin-like negative regulator of GroEL